MSSLSSDDALRLSAVVGALASVLSDCELLRIRGAFDRGGILSLSSSTLSRRQRGSLVWHTWLRVGDYPLTVGCIACRLVAALCCIGAITFGVGQTGPVTA